MSNIKADFVVIGKGEYEEELKKNVVQEGVEKQVFFKWKWYC